MAFLSGSRPRTALRIAMLIILAAGAGSLLYSKEIGKIYKEWQTKGSSEEIIDVPGQPVTPEQQAQPQGSGQNSPNYGMILPDLNGQYGSQNATEQQGGGAMPESGGHPEAASNATFPEDEAQDPTPIIGGVQATTPSGQQVLVGGTAALQRQDTVITRKIIHDLAGFLVNSYYPPGTHANAGQRGYISASLLTLNTHYAQNARQLFGRSRSEVLQYVLFPSMLEALYRVHCNDFINAMSELARTQERQFQGGPRLMTPAEEGQMFEYYAAYAQSLAAVFEACTASPAIIERLDAYYLAAVETYEKNQAYIAASIAHDQAAPAEQAVTRQEMNRAKAAHDASFSRRESAREELLRSLKRYPGVRDLSDSNILYSAGWINRRLADGSADLDTLAAVSRIMNNLAERMREFTRE